MNLATLANLKPPLIQLLNANRGAYATTVGANSATRNQAYPFDQEVTDALLRADGHIITEGYFKSSNSSLRNRFFVDSSNVANGGRLPEFVGLLGKVEYSLDSINWKPSNQTEDKTGLISGVAIGSYVGTNAFAGLHHIDDEEGVAYHGSPYLRVEYPAYVRTTVLQALEAHDAAILAFALTFLYKNKSQAAFEWYGQLAGDLLNKILTGSMRMRSMMPKAMPGGAA